MYTKLVSFCVVSSGFVAFIYSFNSILCTSYMARQPSKKGPLPKVLGGRMPRDVANGLRHGGRSRK